MHKIYLIVIVLFLGTSCTNTKSFFNGGKVQLQDEVSKVDIFWINNLPFCKVEIAGRSYRFLIDTGAPTSISERLYQEMQLKPAFSSSMRDSQRKKQQAKFLHIPKIKIGTLEVENIGASVFNPNIGSLSCFEMDGIIGANLLAHLYCLFNYNENQLLVSRRFEKLEFNKIDFVWDFHPKHQKTPIISGKILDKKLRLTFDTGFTGNLQVPNDVSYYLKNIPKERYVLAEGIGAVGIYGPGPSNQSIQFKETIQIAQQNFYNEIIDTGESTLIGNDFFKNYQFLIDWKSNKIYFKKVKEHTNQGLQSFGFNYYFTENKATVVLKLVNQQIPIELGDQILKINDIDFSNLNSAESCQYLLNKVEKSLERIQIKVKRGNDTLNFEMKKKRYF